MPRRSRAQRACSDAGVIWGAELPVGSWEHGCPPEDAVSTGCQLGLRQLQTCAAAPGRLATRTACGALQSANN